MGQCGAVQSCSAGLALTVLKSIGRLTTSVYHGISTKSIGCDPTNPSPRHNDTSQPSTPSQRSERHVGQRAPSRTAALRRGQRRTALKMILPSLSIRVESSRAQRDRIGNLPS